MSIAIKALRTREIFRCGDREERYANWKERHVNRESRWESDFKVEIPEFHGVMRGEALLDWIVSAEYVVEFKRVPVDRSVMLVAMKFCAHAAS